MSTEDIDIYKLHGEFFTAFGIPTDVTLAWGLIDEEVNRELWPALFKYNRSPSLENRTEVADAIVDSIYVLFQLSRSLDLPFSELFKEVHRSNMAKMVDGKVIRRSDGKVLKPAGWTPPDLWAILHKQVSDKEYGQSKYEGISNVKKPNLEM